MITSIFSKSKPTNFIIVFFITLIAFLSAWLSNKYTQDVFHFLGKEALLFLVCFSSIVILDFIVGKNSLSKNTKFEILFYGLFILAFFEVTLNLNILVSNFFILLALRRILSIRSQRHLIKKFFDAAFWIAIATFFYFWSILFFILIIASLAMYSDKKINHWLVPFAGVLTVELILTTISILFYDGYFEIFLSSPQVSFDYSHYNSIGYLIAITTLFSFGIWSTIYYLLNIKRKKKMFRASFNVIFLFLIIAFAILVLAPNKNGAEFLFLFAPLSIIIANYIEIIDEKWFREVFMSVLILVPFIVLLLHFNSIIN